MCWSKLRYFVKAEFKDNPDKVDKAIVLLMDDIRHYAAMQYPDRDVRCYIHVAWEQSGHAPKSYHYTGQAVDFHFTGLSVQEQFGILSACREIGGLGFYPNWNNPGWHLDLRPNTFRLTWLCHRHNYTYGPNVIIDFLKRE
jgi:uncharacterized protein YcbK (DUF882 family)